MLVNCAAYENGEKVADIPLLEIRANLARPGRFVWVAVKDPDPAELQTLQAEFDLHEGIESTIRWSLVSARLFHDRCRSPRSNSAGTLAVSAT